MAEGGESPARYRDVLAVGEFRALFTAHVLSIVGDQLTRVSLAVLVFDRTGSPALAALTYALAFVPELVGVPLLSGLADRFPRRALLVRCDLLRAGLVAVMAVPALPIWLLGTLLIAVQFATAPFKAARAAILPTILTGDRFEVGNGMIYASFQIGLLGGYAVAAPLVAVLGAGPTLLLDATTFVLSAILIARGLGPHPPVPKRAVQRRAGTTFRAVAGLVWRDRRLRYLVALSCLAGCYAVPTGLAVPYAAQIGAGTAAVGLLLAAMPAGSAVGAVLITRLVPPGWRLRLLGPLAVATCGVLLPTALVPGLGSMVGLLALCGLFSGYGAVAPATFSRMVPEQIRGQAYGLASAMLRAAMGLGVALAGVLAELTTPATAIAMFAAVGVLAGAGAALGWNHSRAAENPTRSALLVR
jgi:MFS family permease